MTKSSVRRVLGEFVVIVAGVLTALAADSWREGRSEEQIAAAYLEQLEIDTRQNTTLLDSAIAHQRRSYESVRLVHETRGGGGRVPADTMRVLLAERYLLQPARVQLVLGTIGAMVASPSVNLVSDPEVRAAVLNYASLIEVHLKELGGFQADLNDAGSDLVVAWQADTDFELDGLHERLSGRSDARTNEALARLWLSGQNAVRVLGDLRRATETLSRALASRGE